MSDTTFWLILLLFVAVWIYLFVTQVRKAKKQNKRIVHVDLISPRLFGIIINEWILFGLGIIWIIVGPAIIGISALLLGLYTMYYKKQEKKKKPPLK